MLDRDADHRAAHDRRGVVASPASAALKPGVQAVPGLHRDSAVTRVVRGELGVGLAPAGRVRTPEPGAVTAGPAGRAGGCRGGVGIEDPVGADADQHAGPGVRQSGAERDRIVAGVEHEQWQLTVVGEAPDEALHLGDGCCHRVRARRDAPGVEGGGPAVGCPVELADPLIGPAGDDRLAGGVL